MGRVWASAWHCHPVAEPLKAAWDWLQGLQGKGKVDLLTQGKPASVA